MEKHSEDLKHLLEEGNGSIHLLVGDESLGMEVGCQNLTCLIQDGEAISWGAHHHHRKYRLGADHKLRSAYTHIEMALETQCGETKWGCDPGTCVYHVKHGTF